MSEPDEFARLVDMAMSAPGRSHMRPVIEKELLHSDLLFALDRAGLLDDLTFQGGTALRLCYQAPRFSEDLDFVGGTRFARPQLAAMKSCIEDYVGRRYGLEVFVKEPSDLPRTPEPGHVNVDRWQVSVVTAPSRRDLPRQRVRIEVANVPAYSRVPRALQAHYEFLPDGYEDTLILTESLDEILTDKVVSLVNTSKRVRHRDIWDLRWLRQRGASLNPDWLRRKIRDYSADDYPGRLATTIRSLPEIVHGEAFAAEMTRFIPLEVQERTLQKPAFRDLLAAEVQSLLIEAAQNLPES